MKIKQTDKPKDIALKVIYDYCEKMGVEITEAFEKYHLLKKYYSASKEDRPKYRDEIWLEKHWYDSLKSGTPDYGVYADPYYFTDMINCFNLYSRNYVLMMNKVGRLMSESILDMVPFGGTLIDMGCGIGLASMLLKDIRPDLEIYATNIEDTDQWRYMVANAEDMGAINLISEQYPEYPQADIIFASEYFEHILNADEHLVELIEKAKPKMLVCANAFNARSTGHFDEYIYEGKKVANKEMPKLFKKRMIQLGYEQVKTGFFNNRPQLFIKKNGSN